MTCLFKKSDLKLGAVPLVKDSETKHMLICGTTGSGKTNALRQLMKQIQKRGDRAIVVDTTGDFVGKFFREEKDILFNPYDARSERWHLWWSQVSRPKIAKVKLINLSYQNQLSCPSLGQVQRRSLLQA